MLASVISVGLCLFYFMNTLILLSIQSALHWIHVGNQYWYSKHGFLGVPLVRICVLLFSMKYVRHKGIIIRVSTFFNSTSTINNRDNWIIWRRSFHPYTGWRCHIPSDFKSNIAYGITFKDKKQKQWLWGHC